MFGIVVTSLLIGYNVWQNDANPVVLLDQYAENLYAWHFWMAIVSQMFFFVTSLVLLIIRLQEKDQNKHEKITKTWTKFCSLGLRSFIGSLAAILGSGLLVKLTANHPTELNQLSASLSFMVALMYMVCAWQTLIARSYDKE